MRLLESIRFFFGPFFLAFSLLGWAAGAPALGAETQSESSPLSVKAELNQAVITIGDPVEYTVTLRHAPSLQILSSIPAPAQDILKLKKTEDFKRTEDKQSVEGKKFTLTAFKLGEFILEPVQIQYRSGGKVETLSTDPLYLTVKSVAQGEEKTDIRGVKSVIPFAGRPIVILLLLLAALGGACVFGYLRLRKRSREIPAGPETLLSPEEAALSRLNQLFDSDLIRRGKIKEYYLALSEILRAYFEGRYKILAIESTTYEILRALIEKDIDRALRQKIEEVLSAADLAKFAKWIPEPSQIIQLNQKSKQVIEESRPQEAIPRGI